MRAVLPYMHSCPLPRKATAVCSTIDASNVLKMGKGDKKSKDIYSSAKAAEALAARTGGGGFGG